MAVTPFNDITGAASFIATTPGTTVFTVAASHVRTVSKCLITNTDVASAVTATIFHIPSGGSFSGDDYVIIKAFSVGPSDGVQGTEDVRELVGEIFEAGDKLVIFAGTGSKLKYSVSGVDNG
jgi:hypothetical protein